MEMSGDHLKDHTEGWSGSDWGVGGGGVCLDFTRIRRKNGMDL